MFKPPTSPYHGQQYTYQGRTRQWDQTIGGGAGGWVLIPVSTTDAEAASQSAAAAAASASAIQGAAAVVLPAAASAVSAADSAAAIANRFPDSTAALSNGVLAIASLVGGSGGANGTFNLAFSGGAGSGAAGKFVVVGGIVTQVFLGNPGSGYTSAPAISFAASAGLTGASAAAVIGINVPDQKFFSTPSPVVGESAIIWQNVSGVAVEKSRTASAERVARNTTDIAGTRGYLAAGGILRYKGAGTIHPILTDVSNRALLWFDATAKSVFGMGLVNKSTLTPSVRGIFGAFGQAEYKGAGLTMIPLVSDAFNRALLYWDVAQKKWKGPGLSDGGGGTVVTPITYARLLDLALKPIAKAINHLLFYGQSLSIGATALTILSTTQPYQNKTFASGPRGAGNDYSAMKLLVEDALAAPDGASNRGETVCSGAANYASTLSALAGRDPNAHVIFASTAGHGGYRIDQLAKGTAWYPQLLAHAAGAHALNADHAVHVVGWIQGENDAVSGTRTPYATYRAALEQLQVDMDTDIRAITGQTAPVYVLTYQLSYAARVWPAQAKAQLDLAQKNDKFVLVTPIYHLPYASDNVHLTSVGYKWLGAYFGRAYNTMVLEGKRPKWLNPISATRRGAVIRVRFDVPAAPLVLDITTLAATTDYGFKVLDGASAAAISSVAVDGSDLLVTLAAVPAGAVTFRAGLDYIGAGLTFTEGASTNLRDSDPSFITISGTNYPLYNVCPHFEMPVVKLGE